EFGPSPAVLGTANSIEMLNAAGEGPPALRSVAAVLVQLAVNRRWSLRFIHSSPTAFNWSLLCGKRRRISVEPMAMKILRGRSHLSSCAIGLTGINLVLLCHDNLRGSDNALSSVTTQVAALSIDSAFTKITTGEIVHDAA